MKRPLTKFELNILSKKSYNWTHGLFVENGLIQLGNGSPEDGTTGYLPYEVLMNPLVTNITDEHVLPNLDDVVLSSTGPNSEIPESRENKALKIHISDFMTIQCKVRGFSHGQITREPTDIDNIPYILQAEHKRIVGELKEKIKALKEKLHLEDWADSDPLLP